MSVIMDKVKVANGVARCGLLFTGLLGLYLSHNKRIPGYMVYVSWYITCIGLGALAQYLIEGDYKESEEKDKDSQTTQKGTVETLATEKESETAKKISREEFDKEADKILLELNGTDSTNVPRKIGLPNLEHVDPEAIEKANFEQLVELGQASKDELILRTSPVKMQVLDIDNQNLNRDSQDLGNSERQLAEYAGDVIDQLRLRQITREPK